LPSFYFAPGGITVGNPNGVKVLHTFANTGNAVSPSVASFQDAYILGGVYKVTKHVAVYFSETTNAGIASNSPLWQDGKAFEYGIKSEFFNQRLSVTADHFQLSEQNVAAPNPCSTRVNPRLRRS